MNATSRFFRSFHLGQLQHMAGVLFALATSGGCPSSCQLGESPPPPPPVAPAEVEKNALDLSPFASGFRRPVFLTSARDGSGLLFVVEQSGVILLVDKEGKHRGVFADLKARLDSSSGERGLLGLAFHPDYPERPEVFVAFTGKEKKNTVSRFKVTLGELPVLDAASEEILLNIEDPASNHNGGMIAFGPDGYLYVGTGDGGGGGDSYGTSRDGMSLHAKMLRLDVNRKDEGLPYAIPSDNPFRDRDGYRKEIWATGLRNPWRFSFDRDTGDLFIADVGQNKYEEVHVQPRTSKGGEDYGWNVMEGLHCFAPAEGCATEGLTLPVVEYAHGPHCSITGGYVYRGKAVPALVGTYLYADFCTGTIFALTPKPGIGGDAAPTDRFLAPTLVANTGLNVSSFGEDDDGELYVIHHGGAIYRVTGYAPPR